MLSTVIVSSLLGYLLALCTLRASLVGGAAKVRRVLFWVLLLFAVCTHAFVLHHWIDVTGGTNLSGQNLFSMLTWLCTLLCAVVSCRVPQTALLRIILPVAVLSLLLGWLMPSYQIIQTATDPKALVHVLLAMLTLSVLCLAGLQAIVLMIAHHRLHAHQRGSASGIMQRGSLPIETMENRLFQWIILGFVLLTVVLLSSVVFFYHDHWDAYLWQKMGFTVAAWVTFAVLLMGRFRAGWRGKKAVVFTLIGLALVLVTYFGSELFLVLFS